MADRTIFITGAAAGIGKATAQLFHHRGFRVGLFDIDADGVARLAEELGERTLHGALDVTDLDAFTDAARRFQTELGRFDVLHNNAGILKMGNFDRLSMADHRRTFEVNVNGVMNGVEAALPHLRATARAHGRARIVNMCSASAIWGIPGLSSYSASKFAVRALTEALNVELDPDGVIVSSILPSFVGTDLVHTQQEQAPIFTRLGLAHTAQDIAELIWEAAHGEQLHYFGNRSLAVGDKIAHAAPRLARFLMKRASRA